MAFSLQANKSTTLSADITDSDTSLTLSSAVFTNFTGDYLVIDYDNPSKLEIIFCTVSGTSVSSITRAQDSTSAVSHSAGAKIMYGFVPSHYANGLGKIAANDAWGTWAPTYGGGGSMTFGTVTTNVARYIQLGKTVLFQVSANGTTGGSADQSISFTLPVTPKSNGGDYFIGGGAFCYDSGSKGGMWTIANGTSTIYVRKYDASNWGLGSGRLIVVSGAYEAA